MRGYQVGERQPTSRASRCRSTTTSTTTAASSPGSTTSPASGPTATTSIRRSISTCSKSAFAISTRWQIIETPQRLETVRRIVGFQRRLVESGAFANPRSHIYYLPELYCAYFGRCYAAFMALPRRSAAGDRSRRRVRVHSRQGPGLCRDELIATRDEPVRRRAGADGAGASRRRVSTFAPALHCIVAPVSAKAAGAGHSRPMNGTR